jgi:predicted transcriptional regulator
MTPNDSLSRRERQILDIVYRLGRAGAAEVQSELPDPPSYSAVRATLRIMEDKGHLRHRKEGPRYLYEPTTSLRKVRRSALQRVVETFFDGSPEDTFAALLELPDSKLESDELARLEKLIREARKKGR